MRQATCQTLSSLIRSELFRNNPGTGLTLQGAADILRIGDESLFASGFKEANDRLDFGSHRTFREVRALRKIFLRFSQRNLIEPLLIGLAKIQRDFLDRC